MRAPKLEANKSNRKLDEPWAFSTYRLASLQ